jgi:hypothetical protein
VIVLLDVVTTVVALSGVTVSEMEPEDDAWLQSPE